MRKKKKKKKMMMMQSPNRGNRNMNFYCVEHRCVSVIQRDMLRTGYKFLIGTPERKKSIGRSRRRWECDIKLDLREVGCEYMD
jgi:hypothetical protein